MTADDWQPYTFPLAEAWRSAAATLTQRSGRLLRLAGQDGVTGWGDCAPLPSAGIDADAATSYAEECAMLDCLSQRAGLPLHAWLSGAPPVARLCVNAQAGALSELAPAALLDFSAAGYRVIKLKLGLADPATEIAMLHRLADTLPAGVTLRLDANRAWNDAQARNFISALSDLPIDGLEEPLASPTPSTLAALQARAAFPLALDESLPLNDRHFFHHPPVRRIVLKPARCGSLLAACELGLRARAAGLEVIVTHALESRCGWLAAAQLAAALAPEAVHGLDDSYLGLADPPTWIADGELRLPARPGIGYPRPLSPAA